MSLTPNREQRMRPNSQDLSRVEYMPSNTASAYFATEESLDWLVLQTRARFERRASDRVLSRPQSTLVPVARERRRWTDRYETIQVPMFPGYVFVRAGLKATDRLAILQSSGVFGFVTYRGSIAQVSDRQIRYLRTITQHNTHWSPYRFIADGPQVRIRGGQLDGVEGFLASDKAGKKLVISIESMQRAIAVGIEGCECEML